MPGSGVTLYRDGRYLRVRTDDDFGPRVVESFHPEGVSYTPYAAEAIAAVDRGEAAAAFLLEPVTVDQVARVRRARRDDAAEVDLLLPEAHLGPTAVPRMSA